MATPVADPAAIAAVQDILREVWVADALESQLLEETILLDWIEDVTDYTDSDGLRASVPLRTGRSGGISSRHIGATLGPAGHQRVAKAYYNYTFHYATVKILGPIVAKMKTQRQAAVREVDFEVKTVLEDAKQDLQRQLQCDGTGALGTVADNGGGVATIVVTDALGKHAIRCGWIYEGMWLDGGSLANPTLRFQGQQVIDIDTDTNTITLDATVDTIDANTVLFRYGNRTAAAGSAEMMGLDGIIKSTGTLGGIDPTSSGNKYWRATTLGNSGTLRAMSIDLLMQVEQKLRQRGGKSELLTGDLDQERAYYNLLEPKVRFIGDKKMSEGNLNGLEFNGKVFVGDPHHIPHKVRFLNKKSLFQISAGPMTWQNQTTGGDILAWSQGEDAFVARAAKYGNLATDHRRGLGALEDLQGFTGG